MQRIPLHRRERNVHAALHSPHGGPMRQDAENPGRGGPRWAKGPVGTALSARFQRLPRSLSGEATACGPVSTRSPRRTPGR
eukprot:6453658-Alexandrium_andersonii.AAC.1